MGIIFGYVVIYSVPESELFWILNVFSKFDEMWLISTGTGPYHGAVYILDLVFNSFPFQGEKHYGYNVLLENYRRCEDNIQEMQQFLKDKASFEEEVQRMTSKNATKVRSF